MHFLPPARHNGKLLSHWQRKDCTDFPDPTSGVQTGIITGYDFEMVKYIVIRGRCFLYYRFSLVFIHIYIYIHMITDFVLPRRFSHLYKEVHKLTLLNLVWGEENPPNLNMNQGVRCQTIKE